MSIPPTLPAELGLPPHQVAAAVRLLDEGATVPFIARYRKEATGGLDDVQLRALDAALTRLRAVEALRERILAACREQGVLTPGLERQLREADTKARLDDLYEPFRSARKTKASLARAAGLDALLDRLLADPRTPPERAAATFVQPGFDDADAALEGARAILIARVGEDADLVDAARAFLRDRATLSSRVVKGKEAEAAKLRDWFRYDERLTRVPSHRALACLRGKEEGLLTVTLDEGDDNAAIAEQRIAAHLRVADRGRPADAWLLRSVNQAWKRLRERLSRQLLTELRERAEATAIEVFATNLHDLLLAAPAGGRVVMGLDPGIRTGVKVAVVDATGAARATTTVYPFAPRNDVAGAHAALAALVTRRRVELIAIGNGTASRETEDLVRTLPEPRPTIVVVSEAGASVYSASELASAELPALDVTLRGAVSIARRLQDPLAELVKIDPKAIGVGQYQHDLPPADLARALDAVVEDCVNAVGVDLATASPALLARVAGLTPSLAAAIVAWRDAHGAPRARRQLLDVPRLGPKAFEQCAGFLRIRDGDDPLDASAVHPEARPVVDRIVRATGRSVAELIGDRATLSRLRAQDFTCDRFGVPTVTDVLAELEKPGRDPRPDFRAPRRLDAVRTLADLAPGMVLEGTVSNVTAFGAFVDLGVHQDGLVHISRLADRFVKDPHTVVRAGQVVSVTVLEVDVARKRISLSMIPGDQP